MAIGLNQDTFTRQSKIFFTDQTKCVKFLQES